MGKFTLTGTDNDGFRHRYSIKKDKNFIKAFIKFMEDLDFDSEDIEGIFYGEDDEGKIIKLNIKEFEDCIRYYQNKKYDVDVFFGRFKVIIVVRTKTRVPMVDHLENKADWIKPLEAKKIRESKKFRFVAPKQKAKNQ
jgi:hypothetical protein